MSNRPTIWILCPVYLDGRSFLEVRDHAREAIAGVTGLRDAALRFVAVDDTGGHDSEIDRLRQHDDVRVIAPPFNLGHQRALVFGLRSLAKVIADDDYVVTMDADGEDRPEDIPALLAPLLADPQNLRRVAVAQRTRRSETALFRVLYFFFRILFRALTGLVIRSGNFAAYRGWLVRSTLFHPHFDLCYSSSFISLNLAVDLVPLARGRRYHGRSRMGFARLLTHGVSMLMPFTERIAVRALVLAAGGLGVALIALTSLAAASLARQVALPRSWWLAALLLALFSFIALGNFLLLFAAFVQSRGSLLRGLERGEHGGS
jgi:hypothetical protein